MLPDWRNPANGVNAPLQSKERQRRADDTIAVLRPPLGRGAVGACCDGLVIPGEPGNRAAG
jgi:hypothetical protein